MRDQLEQLIREMVDKGVHFEDARREFEKRFISHVVQRSDGRMCRAAATLGMHRNTLSRKMRELKIKARFLAG